MDVTFEVPVSEEEKRLMGQVETYLKTMHWPSRVTRKNIGTDPDRRAFVLGKVRKLDVHTRCVNSRFNKLFPELFTMLKQLMHLHNPHFRYNAIQLNANVQTEPHYDRNNAGMSYCLGLGTFRGGGLVIYPENGDRPKRYDNKRKWVLYDGKRTKHGSAPVTSGERFAVIFYRCVPQGLRSRSPRY